MKKEDSVLTSDLGKGIRFFFLCLFFLSSITLLSISDEEKINDIKIRFAYPYKENSDEIFLSSITVKKAQIMDYGEIRKSMFNLYKTGLLSDISIEIEPLANNTLNLFFILTKKYAISDIKVDIKPYQNIDKEKLNQSIYALQKNAFYEIRNTNKAIEEIKNFLYSQGYLAPEIKFKTVKDNLKATVKILFAINPGVQTQIQNILFTIKDWPGVFRWQKYFKEQKYIPAKVDEAIEKIFSVLKKQGFFFPEKVMEITFTDPAKTKVKLNILIDPGYKYIFRFEGMENKRNLILSIWQKKRFEEWTINESKSILINYLKNNGFFHAEITAGIETTANVKCITFTVKKNERYSLGKVTFSGNQTFTEKELKDLIKSDDSFFNDFFWLRGNTIILDQALLKYFYYINGFPSAKIDITSTYSKKNKVNINFAIEEGKRILIQSISLQGNIHFENQDLLGQLASKPGTPYVQQKISEDIDQLRKFYYAHGYDDINITLEMTEGGHKDILFKIEEGKSFKIRKVYIIGGSSSQQKLLYSLFPLKPGADFNRLEVDRFKTEIENSAIFNDITIEKIYQQHPDIDLILKVIPNNSTYFGFALGWEDQKLKETLLKDLQRGLRGTLEYQGRNIFNSNSSLSAIIQIGIIEKRRIVVSLDTPFFMGHNLDSSARIWQEDETYPTFKFNRLGAGESLVRRVSPNSYIIGSFSWYRTELTSMKISQTKIDKLNVPFDTTALNFSYVIENRDDPFNPTAGDYFSSDLKFGIPFLKNYAPFFKFILSYQKNFHVLGNGNLSLSIRNGLAAGDLSVSERFFAGDIRTYRGASNYRLGPIDPVTGQPVGGNSMLLVNLEATFPLMIAPIDGLYYSIFADMGNIYKKAGDLDIRPKNLAKAIGLSIKYKTPLGPFQIALAWNTKTGKESNIEIHWGIGNAF